MTQHIYLLRRLETQVERAVAAFEAAEAPSDYVGIDRAAKAISSLTKAAVQVEAAMRAAEEREAAEPRRQEPAEESLEDRRERIAGELRAYAAECGIDLDGLDDLEDSMAYLSRDIELNASGG